ncbi:MAG: NAD(P)H-hydrate epimerase [Candidatus Dormibacteraeota bacterium]|nr:NAD(P)H-hydrate epimerase [Candidatus Dormibacteraeota bacterium]
MPPTLSSAQARELDRLAAGRYATPVAWLMEAAGWQAARQCAGLTYVVCGKGNNGGDGLAAARHLHRWGRLAGIAGTDVGAFSGPAAEELAALRALGVEPSSDLDLAGAELVLDAVLGTGLHRAPEGRVADWIEAMNASGRRVIALDVPSGLDADSGATPGVCVRAAETLTLGLAKAGLVQGRGPEMAGRVWLADIGIPNEAYLELGVQVPLDLFSHRDRFELLDSRT